MKFTVRSQLTTALVIFAMAAPPVHAQSGPPPLDPAIAAAIKAAPASGNVYSVNGETTFTGRVLKADTITFASGSTLLMSNLSVPWIAIVARKLQIAAPDERFTIITASSNQLPSPAFPIAKLGPAASGNGGSPTNAGGRGANGAAGQTGNPGSVGASGPVIYLIADDILTQPNAPRPTYMDMLVVGRGGDGGNGGPGQPGQDGGSGGSGGPARWNGFTCDGGAGDGGPGGAGGAGGNGGAAGRGGNGSVVVLAGPEPVLNMLSFGRFNTLPGKAGQPGQAAAGGNGGAGGPRGERRGGCGGGTPGPNGPGGGSGLAGLVAASGTRGIIKTASVSAASLF